MQRGAIPIPKSVKLHRIEENFDVWSWHIPNIGMLDLERSDLFLDSNNQTLTFFVNPDVTRKNYLDANHSPYYR